MVKSAVHSEVARAWCDDISNKPSLKYINTESLRVGTPHPVWQTVHDNVHDSRRAQLKCRILTGTYNLNVTERYLTSTELIQSAGYAVAFLRPDNTSSPSVLYTDRREMCSDAN